MGHLDVRVRHAKKEVVVGIGHAVYKQFAVHGGLLFWEGLKYNSHHDAWETVYTMLHKDQNALLYLAAQIESWLKENA